MELINEKYSNFINNIERRYNDLFESHDRIALFNQNKVLEAMKKNKLAEPHFKESTGYGYDDSGRDVVARIFADTFDAEAAIVRPQIVSGTHAITLCLFGILRPGDNFVSVTGKPYDTIYSSIGNEEDDSDKGSLTDFDIEYREVDISNNLNLCYDALKNVIDPKTKLIYIQRSTGYSMRPALTIDKISKIVKIVRSIKKDVVILTDNCYGEFIEIKEPCSVGVDLIAGSLIKNPGGGLALTGGYVAGKKEYVDKVMCRLTTPSLGDEVGANLGTIRSYLQGFFIAPSVTNYAVKGAILTSAVMSEVGFDVFPGVLDERSDIIQAIVLNSRKNIISYCKGIQSSSPVDSYVDPVPWDMPGYESEVIMAAGNFVQGSSIELSADSPMLPPYIVYQQGGLTYEHIKIALSNVLKELKINI